VSTRSFAAALALLLVASPAVVGCQRWPTSPVSTPAAKSISPAPVAGTVDLRVTTIADGDTFSGKDATGAKVKVRMLSIDAPELAHDGNKAACGSAQAAARLRELISGQQVSVIADPRSDASDRYGRRLGYVELDGRDIGLKLIGEGLVEAWYPSSEPRPERFGVYSTVEDRAKQQRTGSWATCPTLGR
jgi:micrococcal nuclease